jgi:hypothetical protein
VTLTEARAIADAATVGAAAIVRAQPWLDHRRSHERHIDLLRSLASTQLPPGMGVAAFLAIMAV